MRLILAFFTALFILVPLAAHAKSVSVKANKTTALTGFYVYNPKNCHSSGQLKYKITRKPEHGTVTVKFQRGTIPDDARRCAGKQAGAMVVYYKPRGGYRGKDNATVVFYHQAYENSHQTRPQRFNYNISVK